MMVDTYDDPLADYTSDISSLSSPTQTISMSDKKPSRSEINRRLAQAINYLNDEGGEDSAATYMEHVARINDYLVQQLPQQGADFDNALYQRLRAAVQEELKAFDEATRHGLLVIESEESTLESGSDVPLRRPPKHHSASVAHALHRRDENLYDFTAEPMGKGRKTPAKIQREREFKYGGPSNHVEIWHSNFPPILPFPETHRMAHWESLKIDFDLSESGKRQKAEGSVVETNVSFDHPVLQQYNNLPLYESGSQFKLPKSSKKVEEEVKLRCTVDAVARVVDDFNKGEYEEWVEQDYTPRIFLDKLMLEQQSNPTDVRRAVNVSPSKPRRLFMQSSTQPGVSNPLRMKPLTPKSASSSIAETPSPTADQIFGELYSGEPRITAPQTRENRVTFAEDNIHAAEDEARSVERTTRAARGKARGRTDQVKLGKMPSDACAQSPVVRKINKERAISLEKSPRRQSGVSTAPQSAAASPTDAVFPQQISNRAYKPNTSATSNIQPADMVIDVAIPKPNSSNRTIRRKRSIGDQAYSPESKRSKHATLSSLRKDAGGKHQTPDRSVRSTSGDDSDCTSSNSDMCTTAAGRHKQAGKGRIPKPVGKRSPKSKGDAIDVSVQRASETSSYKLTAATKKSPIARKLVAKVSAKSGGKSPNIATVAEQKSNKAATAGRAMRSARIEKGVGKHVQIDEYMGEVQETIEEPVKAGGTRSGARYLK